MSVAAPVGSAGPPGERAPGSFWLALVVVLGLFHVPTFHLPHKEGDELVYLGLSRKTSWTLGDYTTSGIDQVNEYPARMYRAPYFIHPPFFPLLLKSLGLLGDPITLGLAANAALHIACCILVASCVRLLGGSAAAQMIAALTTAQCPVLMAATVKLHIDAWSGFLLLLSVHVLLHAARDRSPLLWLLAGLVYGCALNTKLTALASLPGFLLVSWLLGRRWGVLWQAALFWVMAFALAAPHCINLLREYSTLYPSDLLVHDRPTSDFLKKILARGHLRALLYTFALTPFTLLWLTPGFWRFGAPEARGGTMIGAVVIVFINLWAAVSIVHYATERYWALYLPTFYVLVGLVVDRWLRRQARFVPGLLVVVWGLMATSALFIGVLFPVNDVVVPSLVLFLPSLRDWYY